MIGADRGPAAVRDGDSRAARARLEQHLDLGALGWREVGRRHRTTSAAAAPRRGCVRSRPHVAAPTVYDSKTRPPTCGSSAIRPASPGAQRKRGPRRHHSSISSVKMRNACAGGTATPTVTRARSPAACLAMPLAPPSTQPRSACALNACNCSLHSSCIAAAQSLSVANTCGSSRYRRTRASCTTASAATRPLRSSWRRWRLRPAGAMSSAAARSPARCGRSRSSSTTAQRVGSASAAKARASAAFSSACCAGAARTTSNAPRGRARRSCGRPSSRRRSRAPTARRRCAPGGARLRAMRIDIVDVQHQPLRVGAVERLGAQHVHAPARAAPLAADHQHRLAVAQLAVLDAAFVALDLEPQLEAERLAQPIDHAAGILVVRAGRQPRPAGGVGFIGHSLRLLIANFVYN